MNALPICLTPPPLSSDEDTNIKALVTAWLKSLPPSPLSLLEGWIEDYFYQALDWVVRCGDLVVNTTQVGVAMNGLSHLVGVASKAEFACALVRGLGGNLPLPTRERFAKEVSQEQFNQALACVIHVYYIHCVSACLCWVYDEGTASNLLLLLLHPLPHHQVFHMTHEIPPDSRRLLDTYYDHTTGRLATYQLQVQESVRILYSGQQMACTYMYVHAP